MADGRAAFTSGALAATRLASTSVTWAAGADEAQVKGVLAKDKLRDLFRRRGIAEAAEAERLANPQR